MSDIENEKGERIAKRMARAGLCSRRDAERWIAERRLAMEGRLDRLGAFLDATKPETEPRE